jgi:hypothetical protein
MCWLIWIYTDVLADLDLHYSPMPSRHMVERVKMMLDLGMTKFHTELMNWQNLLKMMKMTLHIQQLVEPLP